MNMRFGGSTLARSVPAALDIYADILLRPHIPAAELEAAQSLALQDIQSLEDSPEGMVMVELRRRYYPQPLCKDRLGKAEDIEGLTIDAVRAFHGRHFHPNGTILSVAGNVQWEPLKAQVERLFGGWKPSARPEVKPEPHAPESSHIQKETHQTHIAFAYPSVPIGHPDYYAVRAAEGVLSGGMSARLFAEVREKRGLCYAVGVGHETFKDRGTMVGYAGTGADRAQETLDVTLAELRKLKDGIEDDEIDRVKAGLKSALIMQEESTSARAAAISSDWYFLGRVRSSDEIQAAIDSLTPKLVTDHLARFPIRGVKIVTVGPKPLTVPE
jgi:predicted Zn-dependent peptidase